MSGSSGAAAEGAAAAADAHADENTRPNRLHRRDTPHHLKNKRINPAQLDKDKVASIIAQVSLYPHSIPIIFSCFFCVYKTFFFFFSVYCFNVCFNFLSSLIR